MLLVGLDVGLGLLMHLSLGLLGSHHAGVEKSWDFPEWHPGGTDSSVRHQRKKREWRGYEVQR